MSNENEKNNLIKNLDMQNLSNEEKNVIIKNIKQLDFNSNDIKNLKYTYQNKINNMIENKKKILKDQLLGKWYNKEKSIDDLIISILFLVLIFTIVIKFGTNISELTIFLLNKIIFPNLMFIIIIISILIIYIFKKNMVYDILNFIIIWIKIFTFQWLF